MTKTEIAEKIKNMISENLRIPENMLDDDAELFGGDIGLDSVDSLEIISGIDDLFGVDMTGVDRSPEMLSIAREKAAAAGRGDAILFLCQDMLSFELYGTALA